jgi:hypothetical protein
MARNPVLAAQDRSRAAAQKVKDAVSAARGRVGGEGRLVVFAAACILTAFVLLAILAPILMRAPGFVSYLAGALLFILILVGTGAGILALWRMMQGGVVPGELPGGPLNQAAVEAALSEAEECGLKATGPRVAEEGVSGRIAGRPIVVVRCEGRTYGVVRLKEPAWVTVLVAPGAAHWPFALPNDGKLTPLPAPIDGLAWATERQGGQDILLALTPALVLAASAGEAPLTCVRAKAMVMMWERADVGSAALVISEAARHLEQETFR